MDILIDAALLLRTTCAIMSQYLGVEINKRAVVRVFTGCRAWSWQHLTLGMLICLTMRKSIHRTSTKALIK